MLLLSDDEVQKFLSMDECIAAVEEAFKSLGAGRAYNIPRGRIRTEPFERKYSYWMHCIPGAVPELGVAALRIDSAVQILSDDPGRFKVAEDRRDRRPRRGEDRRTKESASQITFYNNNAGVGVVDVSLAAHIYRLAKERGLGQEL